VIDRGASAHARWRLLSAVVPTALEDEIASVLGQGSLGVEVVPSGAGRSAVRVYLGTADDAAAWTARAERILLAHGIPLPGADLGVSPVPDGRWGEKWQAALAPIPLGARFVVVRGGAPPPGGREPIRLVPGMAFGTGEHETTRLCAAALERLVRPGSRWLDVGTGSGILAIVAARCGAGRVLALDIDPEAVHVAGEAVAANGAEERVEVRVGSLEDREEERFDGIVANVAASFFLERASRLGMALDPGGVLAASGVLEDDLDEIAEALRCHRLVEEHRSSEPPWACLIARLRS